MDEPPQGGKIGANRENQQRGYQRKVLKASAPQSNQDEVHQGVDHACQANQNDALTTLKYANQTGLPKPFGARSRVAHH